MCGINFIFSQDPVRGKAKEILSQLEHRGIRENDISLFGDSVQLAHRRLPIQGLTEEFDQPFHYKNWIIGFVGEIFNYKHLDPSARSDVQVLAKMWDRIGIEAFGHFDGFWSVIIIDIRDKLAHVITDSLAKKPLYIRDSSDITDVRISSEIFPLVEKGDELDPLYFSSVAKWGYALNDGTPFKKIKKIPPFTHMVIDLTFGEHKEAYFYDSLKPKGGSLRPLLEEAVKNRLVSDVPVSLLLSGGLDSTILFELVKKRTHYFTVFHVDNQEAEFLNYLDFPSAVRVKKIHLEEIPYAQALLANQTPVDLGSVHPQYAIAKAIWKEKFNVAISGDGADELFGGYKRIKEYDSQYSDIFEELVYYHLPRLDRIMMNWTIELRCPYLSRPVIENALSLPYESRIDKAFLKDTFSDIVPKEILNREKHPLKTDAIRKTPMIARLDAIRLFKALMGVFYECRGYRIGYSDKRQIS
jgi:asparagine synthase (glutamine-hydrolysing)